MESSPRHLFKHDVQRIFNTFTALLDVRIAFFTARGKEIKVGLDKPWCGYCSLVRTRLDLEALCTSNDAKRMKESEATGVTVRYTCHAGLEEVIKPITLGCEPAGFLMIGQFRNSSHPPGGLVSLWKRNVDTDELRKAFTAVPYFSPEKAEHLVSLFNLLCDYIVENHMIYMDRKKNISDVLIYMEKHIQTPFTLDDAATLTGLSPSRTAHLFRQRYRKGFKEMHNELRIRRAQELLRGEEKLNIQQIAERTGFSDPLYFSRFFRKHTGMSPSAFRIDQHSRRETPGPGDTE